MHIATLTKVALLTILAVHTAAGSANDRKVSDAPVVHAKAAPRAGTSLSLTIVGFNYTNREIDSFTVGGNGGGNLPVDSGNGGGGSLCCATHVVGQAPADVEVRWQADACTYDSRMSGGEEFFDIHRIYKTDMVRVDPQVPARPHYLEVHIFPDDHVEVAITEELSTPRLKLDPARVVNPPLRKCPNDKKPV